MYGLALNVCSVWSRLESPGGLDAKVNGCETQPWQERSRLLPQFVFNHLQVHIVDVVALKSCLAKTFKIINLCVAFNARSPVHTRLSTLKLSALDRDFTRLYCQISQSYLMNCVRRGEFRIRVDPMIPISRAFPKAQNASTISSCELT